ncbi:MAG: DUF349 domain-containing protein, partial [Rhodospirillales bacterium]|nr:DUF349 domain-containing protein [Rhodospirillales bacterium]
MDNTIQHLTELCVEAETLAKAPNWEAVGVFFAEAGQKWIGLDPDGIHDDLKKRFDEAHATFTARLEHDKVRKARIAEREAFCAEIEAHSSSDNAAEFADRVHEIKSAWHDLPYLQPQYLEILQARFDKAVHAFSDSIELQREELALRNERLPEIEHLCGKVEDLAEGSEWILAEQELKEIRKRWLHLVAGLKGMEPIHERFDQALASFNRRKGELASTLEAELKLLGGLCGEMESCLKAEDLKSMLPKVKEIKERWKVSEIRDTAKEELQKHFRTMLNAYHKKIHGIFEEEDWSRWENYTIKVGLCEKAEKLPAETNFNLRFKLLKELQEEWKRIGPVPREKSDEIWNRFHQGCETTYRACRDFFNEQTKKRAQNLRGKTALCEQAEALQESTDWEGTADRLKALQVEWRGIGSAPKDKEEEALQRFRKACNTFFERRKAHYGEIHRIQAENKKAKMSLCEQAEALLSGQDLMASISIAMDLRRKWRDAAAAARGDEHALWDRFNSTLGKFFAHVDQVRNGNFQRKQEICADIERLANSQDLKDDCDKVAGTVRSLEDEWRRIGPSPRDKGRDVEDQFHSVLRLFDGQYREARRELQSTFASNVNAKEAILVEIAELASSADGAAGRVDEAAAAFEEAWRSGGPVPQERAANLEARFGEAMAALKAGDVGYFSAIALKQKEN